MDGEPIRVLASLDGGKVAEASERVARSLESSVKIAERLEAPLKFLLYSAGVGVITLSLSSLWFYFWRPRGYTGDDKNSKS